MSDLKSKVAYLQGLSKGMNISEDNKEGKLLNSIIDVLGEFADSFDQLEDAQEQLEDYIETVDDDLYTLENELHGGEEEDYVEVDCPRCGETVLFDPGIIEDDEVIEVTCPNCDEVVFVNDDTFASADEAEELDGQAAPADEDI